MERRKMRNRGTRGNEESPVEGGSLGARVRGGRSFVTMTAGPRPRIYPCLNNLKSKVDHRPPPKLEEERRAFLRCSWLD